MCAMCHVPYVWSTFWFLKTIWCQWLYTNINSYLWSHVTNVIIIHKFIIIIHYIYNAVWTSQAAGRKSQHANLKSHVSKGKNISHELLMWNFICFIVFNVCCLVFTVHRPYSHSQSEFWERIFSFLLLEIQYDEYRGFFSFPKITWHSIINS